MTRRAGTVGLLLGAVLALAGAAPARADEQPSILKAYNLDWIERVREEAWPLPKEQRPVICLLDTGVAVTPDTPEDNPLGPIVARLAVDGGTGLPQGTEPLHLHGTQMASVMAAPRNNWGTVGVFPQARIVSIRVTDGADTHITPANMVKGVEACIDYSSTQRGWGIAAIAMPETNYDQRASDSPRWAMAVERAGIVGAAFIAALGNHPGGDLAVPPAAVSGVVTVGPSQTDGSPCSFFPAEVAPQVWAPGCASPGWPAGSSTATAVVAAAVASLRSRTDASVSEAVAALSDHGRLGGARARTTVFHGLVADPEIPGTDDSVLGLEISKEVAPDVQRVLRLWRPKIRASWRRGWLTLSCVRRSRCGRLEVQMGKSIVTGVPESGRLRVRMKSRRRSIAVRVVGRAPKPWQSLQTQVRVTKGTR